MKYVIEIDDVPMIDPKGNKVWRAKNFKTLVFDEADLKKLDKFEDNADAKKRAEFASLRVGDVILNNWDRYMVIGIREIYDGDTFAPTGETILDVMNDIGKNSAINVNDYIKTGFRKLHKMISINEFFYLPLEELDFC